MAVPREWKLRMDAAFWNDRYAVAGHVYGEAPNAFVAEVASQIPAGLVLCLADAAGPCSY
ncbi:MAG: hypothetical protein ABSA69_09105 [Verrucomicrobiota bacterium]|jgi:hypothetical protein